jgi:hypothetical protein
MNISNLLSQAKVNDCYRLTYNNHEQRKIFSAKILTFNHLTRLLVPFCDELNENRCETAGLLLLNQSCSTGPNTDMVDLLQPSYKLNFDLTVKKEMQQK